MESTVLAPPLPAAVRDAKDLPSMPAVAVEVLRLSQDEDATLDDLAKVLSRDPALAAKLLKVANSSHYSLGADVTTLQRACMVLGLKAVKLMALSFSLVSSLRDGAVGPFSYAEFWRRSAVSAAAARWICRESGNRRFDEAFLCGLLSRLGQLVMARCLGADYGAVVQAARPGWPGADAERAALGYDGATVGASLLQDWALPAEVWGGVLALSGDEAELPPQAADMAPVLRAAALVEEFFCGPDKASALEELEGLAAGRFRWSPDRVEEVLAGIGDSLPELADLLSMDAESVDADRLIAEARGHMLSVGLDIAGDKRRADDRISELAIQNEALKRTSQLDPLTGLTNRAGFESLLDECVTRRRNEDVPDELGLLILDIDHFKRVNDEHGHLVGDTALKMVARIMQSVSRQSDTVVRYGGEEFAVIMPRTTFPGLESLSERIRAAIAADTVRLDNDGRLSLTVSLGGASIKTFETADDARRLVELADRCLYQAKDGGRNRSVFYPRPDLPR